eukprot:scaffold124116_cov23-Tisochrysis_lutea.AAC.1
MGVVSENVKTKTKLWISGSGCTSKVAPGPMPMRNGSGVEKQTGAGRASGLGGVPVGRTQTFVNFFKKIGWSPALPAPVKI